MTVDRKAHRDPVQYIIMIRSYSLRIPTTVNDSDIPFAHPMFGQAVCVAAAGPGTWHDCSCTVVHARARTVDAVIP
jgi:hypothetical protein